MIKDADSDPVLQRWVRLLNSDEDLSPASV